MKIVINGAMGRMGRAVIEEARKQGDFEVGGLLEAPGVSLCGSYLDDIMGRGYEHVVISDRWESVFDEADVLMDFSVPDGTIRILDHLERNGIPLVCGTTGFKEEEANRLQELSRIIPVFYSANFSTGMHLMKSAIQDVVSKLPPSWDVEIVETHHRMKRDAPSGTAKSLACIFPANARPAMHSLRVGDVPGRHTVIFGHAGEMLEFGHAVHSRTAFATGSLAAARFIKGKEAGWYGMDNLYEKTR